MPTTRPRVSVSVVAITPPLRRPRCARPRRCSDSRCSGRGCPRARAGSRPQMVLVVGEQAHGGHHHPGRAVAALEPVLLVERLLERMEIAVVGEPLDRRQLHPVCLDAEQRAGLDRLSVQQHGASAARRGVATDVRAGQPETLAQDVDEELTRLQVELVANAVDNKRDAFHGGLLSAVQSTRPYSSPTQSSSGPAAELGDAMRRPQSRRYARISTLPASLPRTTQLTRRRGSITLELPRGERHHVSGATSTRGRAAASRRDRRPCGACRGRPCRGRARARSSRGRP